MPLDWIQTRSEYPALSRQIDGRPIVHFDGPAGSQVPRRVIAAVADYMAHHNANSGGMFATSTESDALLDRARQAAADLLGTDDPDGVIFGPNMTTLTITLARALSSTWRPGDEIVLTRLEHDANHTPWAHAARAAGVTVRSAEFHRDDCTLDLEHLRAQINERTRLVAVTAASNAVGTLTPIKAIAAAAHAAGGLLFVDAVHAAPHVLLDVREWDCDFLCCSAYKFFGPHLGILWGRRDLLEPLPIVKLRPSSNDLPQRWMTGTQNHEAIAGTLEAVEYLADLGRRADPAAERRRAALISAFAAIRGHEQQLSRRVIETLSAVGPLKLWGLTDPRRLAERVPTFSLTHARHTAREMAVHLAARGICTWHGNFYALPLTEALGLEPEGLLRVGLLHYNTADEIDRLGQALAELD